MQQRSPALSFRNNPSFESLVLKAVTAKSVTLFCGAGTSTDAGIPSWPRLVEILATQARGPFTADTLQAAGDDLLRLAGLLLSPQIGAAPANSRIANALYSDQPAGQSVTYLADAIAQFASAIPEKCAIVTTNFDDVLESALKVQFGDVRPCTFDGVAGHDLADWWAAFDSPFPAVFHLLHLHGFIPRAGSPWNAAGEVILTEADFYRRGSQIQEALCSVFDKSEVVLCLGVSLTDPNLIGALARRKESGIDNDNVYVVSVPGKMDRADQESSEQYWEAKESYLEQLFNLNVIRLNTYAQVHQLMVELELAVTDPRKYQRSGPSSHRYGFRLNRCLRSSYRSLGFSRRDVLTSASMAEASDRLFNMLPVIRAGICEIVRASKCNAATKLVQKAKDVDDHLAAENFGLFLWLPTLFDLKQTGVYRPFQVRLVAASAHVHREPWSFTRELTVDAYGDHPVQIAAFTGRPFVGPANVAHEPRLWRTDSATPVTLRDASSDSSLQAGVVALSSALPFDDEVDYKRVAEHKASILRVLDREDHVRVASLLSRTTAELLGCG